MVAIYPTFEFHYLLQLQMLSSESGAKWVTKGLLKRCCSRGVQLKFRQEHANGESAMKEPLCYEILKEWGNKANYTTEHPFELRANPNY